MDLCSKFQIVLFCYKCFLVTSSNSDLAAAKHFNLPTNISRRRGSIVPRDGKDPTATAKLDLTAFDGDGTSSKDGDVICHLFNLFRRHAFYRQVAIQ
jgi:hypothetical protein